MGIGVGEVVGIGVGEVVGIGLGEVVGIGVDNFLVNATPKVKGPFKS